MNPRFKDKFHIEIPPISIGDSRPLCSVVIPTFNCANYLKETIKSVLDQDLGPEKMEIIVVDDFSTNDDPENVVKELGKGRIKFFQQSQNIGKSGNYSSGILMTTGRYIHLLHGDDTVQLGFYKKIEELFNSYSKASVAFCRCNYMNANSKITGETKLLASQDGMLTNFVEEIATWQLIQPPSIVFKREVYEALGTYDTRLKYIEDWEFYVRSAVFFEFIYTPELFANYRVFSESSSNQSVKGGKRVNAVAQVMKIMDGYLSNDLKQKLKLKRKEAAALYLLNFVPRLTATKDFKGLMVTTKAFATYNSSIHLWGRWLRFIIQYKRFIKSS